MSFTPSENPITHPERESYTELRPFRFWCQKVLPLVYDNSLSYYELLCKVVDYLNKTMEDVDHMNTDMDTLYSNFQEFQEGTFRIYNELVAYVNAYFENLDVQEEINNKLDDMVTSGELVAILQPSIAAEVASWLADHITPTTPAVDDTLTVAGAAADAKAAGDYLRELDKEILDNNSVNIISEMPKLNGEQTGVTMTWNDDKVTFTGTATANTILNFYLNQNGLPKGVKAGGRIYLPYTLDIPNGVALEIFERLNNTWHFIFTSDNMQPYFTVNENATGFLARFNIPINTSVNGTYTPKLYNTLSNDLLTKVVTESFLDNNLTVYTHETIADANTIDKNCIAFVNTNIANIPFAGWLFSFTHNLSTANSNLRLQILYPYDKTNNINYRVRNTTGTWSKWVDNISLIKYELYENNCVNIIAEIDKTNGTQTGVTMTWNNEKVTLSGTATANTALNFYLSETEFPRGMNKGDTVYVPFIQDLPEGCELDVYQKVNNQWGALYISVNPVPYFTISENATGILLRLYFSNGYSFNGTYEPKLLTSYSNDMLTEFVTVPFTDNSLTVYKHTPTPDADLIDMNCICFVSPQSTENVPTNGWLFTYTHHYRNIDSNLRLQLLFPYQLSYKPLLRVRSLDGVYSDWTVFGGGSTNVYNTYNITATPSITTDANGWLASTGDTQDRTADIMTMLSSGYCHLGEGDFYISGNIDMPENSILTGCGDKSRIILINSADTYCIKVNTNTTVKDIKLNGGSPFTVSSTISGRHAIYCNGSESNVKISDVTIEYFSGCGIYFNNTGSGVEGCATINNANIKGCNCGIELDVYAEYNKICNSIIHNCYYACINNSGNNSFNNVTFHGVIGISMNNSGNDKPNSGHGICTGCTFNHIDSMNHPDIAGMGKAIDGKNIPYGYLFTGCQFWYSKVHLEGCTGFNFNGCYFGGNTPVIEATIKPVFISDTIFHDQPTLTIPSNSKVNNCFTSEGSSVTL